MFKPNGTMKKVLRQYNTSATIYTDGVVVFERKKIKEYGVEFEKEFAHVFPCKIGIYLANEMKEFKGRLVIYSGNANMLIDGLARAEVWEDNSTDALKAAGLKLRTIALETPSGIRINNDSIAGLFTGSMAVDYEPASVHEWDTSDRHAVVIHEEKAA